MRISKIFSGTAILSILMCFAAPAPSAEPFREIAGASVAGTNLEKYQFRDRAGRTITYFLSRPKAAKAPLLLMIQGSGCVPVVNEQPGSSYSTLFNLMPFASEGTFSVMAVEKPYSGVVGQDPSSAASCSEKFNSDFTAESWLDALEASTERARRAPWVDTRRMLVFGISEGAVMAALLAGHENYVTDVISVGGSGTTQLFDFVARAYADCFDISGCLTNIDEQLRAIRAEPASSTKFAWGHPYKRWTSFFGVDPSAELLRSNARVYVAFGTGDRATPPMSQEVLVAKLSAAGREMTVRRVPNADHMLMQPGSPDFAALDREFRNALSWFWTPATSPGR